MKCKIIDGEINKFVVDVAVAVDDDDDGDVAPNQK